MFLVKQNDTGHKLYVLHRTINVSCYGKFLNFKSPDRKLEMIN